jgi:hypothetical protein
MHVGSARSKHQPRAAADGLLHMKLVTHKLSQLSGMEIESRSHMSARITSIFLPNDLFGKGCTTHRRPKLAEKQQKHGRGCVCFCKENSSLEVSSFSDSLWRSLAEPGLKKRLSAQACQLRGVQRIKFRREAISSIQIMKLTGRT